MKAIILAAILLFGISNIAVAHGAPTGFVPQHYGTR